MGGPRVTTGEDSKQDYSTPDDFLAAVVKRFGPIQFDLAAHRGNKKHDRYFAPKNFVEKYDPEKKTSSEALIARLVRQGALEAEARPAVVHAVTMGLKTSIIVANHDAEAYGLDAFAHSWAELSRKFRAPGGDFGLLWLNCEFSDIEPWADRCRTEAKEGANSLLLTPAAVGSNWYRDHLAGSADVYDLNGRLCFDGKNVFPKDCTLSHHHPRATGARFIWEWRKDKICRTWRYEP